MVGILTFISREEETEVHRLYHSMLHSPSGESPGRQTHRSAAPVSPGPGFRQSCSHQQSCGQTSQAAESATSPRPLGPGQDEGSSLLHCLTWPRHPPGPLGPHLCNKPASPPGFTSHICLSQLSDLEHGTSSCASVLSFSSINQYLSQDRGKNMNGHEALTTGPGPW